MGRRDCGIGNRKAVSSKLDADLVAEPPYYAAFPAHRLVAGEEQNELIRNHDALGIEPRAALRDIGDETVARQRAGRLDLGHTIDGVALVPAPFLQHEIFDRWMRDIRPNLASKWFKNPYYGLRTGGSLAASWSGPVAATTLSQRRSSPDWTAARQVRCDFRRLFSRSRGRGLPMQPRSRCNPPARRSPRSWPCKARSKPPMANDSLRKSPRFPPRSSASRATEAAWSREFRSGKSSG